MEQDHNEDLFYSGASNADHDFPVHVQEEAIPTRLQADRNLSPFHIRIDPDSQQINCSGKNSTECEEEHTKHQQLSSCFELEVSERVHTKKFAKQNNSTAKCSFQGHCVERKCGRH